jgi:heme ABC exporter ATP-binding subunit CcmA
MTEVGLALQVRGLTKRFGTRTVLQSIDLEVRSGETVVLLGPNGAGKSTLLGCVAGTVNADAGSVRIADRDLRERPLDARAALRYLPQEVEVPAGLTGTELLSFYADVFEDRPGLAAAREHTGLQHVLDHLVTTYSVGMRRRLAFAALLLGRGDLFVLDEPFAGVDAAGRDAMLSALEAAVRRGAGVLMAAHDRDSPELERLGARAFAINP